MNILYIGPYRLNSSIGYESLNFLLELYDNYDNLMSRPVYDKGNIMKNSDIFPLLSKLENKSYSKIDLIIQHLDIDSFAYTTKVPKHLFIPIHQNFLCKEYQKQKYEFLDNKGIFLYKNDIDEYILKDCIVKNKALISPSINTKLAVKNNSNFNLGLYNKYQKYYSIVDSSNSNSIKKIIVDFIKKYQQEQNCLVLFMQNVTQSILDSYNKFIKNVYSSFEINFSINKIIISPIEINNTIIPAIHNTGNIYLDINEDIHSYYAKKYNKIVIHNNSKLKTVYDTENLNKTPSISRSENIDFEQKEPVSSAESFSLSQVVQNYV